MTFDPQMRELQTRITQVLAMGGPEKIVRHHAKGRKTARERIDTLLDPDSFMEVGRFNHSDMPGMASKTPADGKVGGYGEIDGRPVAVISNDFTVMAATSSRVAARKETELKAQAVRRGYPVVYLGEAGGARMPDIMGAAGLASFGGGGPETYLAAMSRVRQTPMATAIMGECYGMPTWMACLSDFVVQVKGSAMGVSGPRVLSLALGEIVSDEELGGWRVHAEVTGNIDRVAEDDDHALTLIQQFLGYLPSHNGEPPPEAKVPPGSGDRMDHILDLLPERRNRAYDMGTLLDCIFDQESRFELKPDFGGSVITCLARIEGRVVGVIANQPQHNAGAMDTDGVDKVISFLCLCDSFNIPLCFFHDIPGFLVGREAERRRVAAKVMNYMNALALVTVPKISIIVRKSYGMAFWNMCGSGCGADYLAAWPSAEMSFVDPAIAANVVGGGGRAGGRAGGRNGFGGNGANGNGCPSPERQAAVEKLVADASPYGAAGAHYIHDVIDPRHTRRNIVRALAFARRRRKGGIGEHQLANWPTKF